MITVWKYEIPVSGADFKIGIPIASTILTVGPARWSADWIAMWAEVDTTVPLEIRTFQVVGTGHRIGGVRCREYRGTVQEIHLSNIWHVYEIGHPV